MGTMAIDSKNSMVSRLEMWIKSDRFYKDGNLKTVHSTNTNALVLKLS